MWREGLERDIFLPGITHIIMLAPNVEGQWGCILGAKVTRESWTYYAPGWGRLHGGQKTGSLSHCSTLTWSISSPFSVSYISIFLSPLPSLIRTRFTKLSSSSTLSSIICMSQFPYCSIPVSVAPLLSINISAIFMLPSRWQKTVHIRQPSQHYKYMRWPHRGGEEKGKWLWKVVFRLESTRLS